MVTDILVVLCAAVPVVAQEILPDLAEQVQDILTRLEKVEAQYRCWLDEKMQRISLLVPGGVGP